MGPVFLGADYDQDKVMPDLSKIKTYLILASPRTGSTLLCSMLYSTARYGVPYEYFNQPINMAGRLGVTKTPKRINSIDMTAYIKALLENRTTGHNMVWGAKVFPPHVSWMLQSELGLKILQRSPVIRLTRKNKLDQAISHVIAAQTGTWNTTSRSQGKEPVFKFGKILQTMHKLQMQDNFWDLLCAKYKLNPLEISYDDLSHHTQATGEKVMKHLTGEPTQFKFSTSPDAVVVDKLDTTHNSAFREKFLNRLKFERAGQATKILSDF